MAEVQQDAASREIPGNGFTVKKWPSEGILLKYDTDVLDPYFGYQPVEPMQS